MFGGLLLNSLPQYLLAYHAQNLLMILLVSHAEISKYVHPKPFKISQVYSIQKISQFIAFMNFIINLISSGKYPEKPKVIRKLEATGI